MTIQKFDFSQYAPHFGEHIEKSIPGYRRLQDKCVSLSQRFIQDDTTVVDVGCSVGDLIARVRNHNQLCRNGVEYIGIDVERKYAEHWEKFRADDLRFRASDLRTFEGFERMSLVFSLFTLQFVPEKDKLGVLRQLRDGMVAGGALLLAEKVLASSARLQDALTFPFYDYKRRSFEDKEILDKERSLRGQMTGWSQKKLVKVLKRDLGFREVETIWNDFPFTAVLALT